ncbi:hypothetical protein LCL97_23130 [Seohaeicola saemankumensis]|nr:hypothetical protein [Seohaeicola saemankumensis]MCA0873736.1 hypothetical protein [Seohaeicola saemankumensis]
MKTINISKHSLLLSTAIVLATAVSAMAGAPVSTASGQAQAAAQVNVDPTATQTTAIATETTARTAKGVRGLVSATGRAVADIGMSAKSHGKAGLETAADVAGRAGAGLSAVTRASVETANQGVARGKGLLSGLFSARTQSETQATGTLAVDPSAAVSTASSLSGAVGVSADAEAGVGVAAGVGTGGIGAGLGGAASAAAGLGG